MTEEHRQDDLSRTSFGPGTRYRCPLGTHYVIPAPFPVFIIERGECVEVIDSDSEKAREILLKGTDITYLGIIGQDGGEVRDMDILTVLRQLRELIARDPNLDHLLEPIDWHIERFEPRAQP